MVDCHELEEKTGDRKVEPVIQVRSLTWILRTAQQIREEVNAGEEDGTGFSETKKAGKMKEEEQEEMNPAIFPTCKLFVAVDSIFSSFSRQR